ncbi:response regulator transcription factor [Ktedonosporobacter rubrisoli]|uniref:Response regulator transcription factor n=1 Tax=Ktedonosporobacter rubrisoli TaxID=2509675 RepID=A0A4P6JQ11_KTERU|nr:LuxR C-terminal-related transcriptional regulator [Ktedonosporobacter rubrisoli]QBD77250.1 response regulator transcription factor [Ktedonosporobacter rubrisoli]
MNNRLEREAEYVDYFVHLTSVTETLCGHAEGVANKLCEEVMKVTKGNAIIVMNSPQLNLQTTLLRCDPISVRFPVRFRGIVYGEMYIKASPHHPSYPSLPLPIAHALAQTCGLILHTLEVSALTLNRNQGNKGLHGAITKRQREVLVLMMHGYDQDAIAEALSISRATVSKHRQNIYQELGVHNEKDALLVAYQAGIVSPIEDISAND